ncbi:MAG TPA: amidohydrolase family protein [Vicinamibacterales bacterium]|nr:amidohydrolase family protein [Vicinamibacterales bacterium]
MRICSLLVLWLARAAAAQEVGPPPAGPTAIVFKNVSLISMVEARVESDRTVVVRGERIVSIGTTDQIVVPPGATVIDGTGRFLMPGLTDAHVHLEAWQGVRPDFGDAPLYLAHGVTTVVNLRGTPEFLDWRRRVNNGELLGPTIYTAGEFIIGPAGPSLRRDSGELVVGPNVTTTDDVVREVEAQARQGVDIIKYYGGLSRPEYLKMNEAARTAGIPVVGHRPIPLELDALLEARQPLAHMHMLTNLYFWPLSSQMMTLFANAAALFVLVLIAASSGVGGLVKHRRPAAAHLPLASRLRSLTGWLLLGALLAVIVQVDVFVFNRLQPNLLLVGFAALTLFVSIVSVALLGVSVSVWRAPNTSTMTRLRAPLTAIAGLVLAFALASFWTRASWRATESGIDRLAQQLRDADIPVETTLVGFAVLTSGPDRLRAMQADSWLDYLAPAIQDGWRHLPTEPAPVVPEPILDFMKTVTARLHRHGVRLVAGTDALGAPLIVPGVSLHDELTLLTQCGLSPYEAIRTATTNAAALLRRDAEFGTVDVGKRADLLLLDRNPLQDLSVMKRPLGVLVRGRWLPREDLDRMLADLVNRR